jgi:hypothetical protein
MSRYRGRDDVDEWCDCWAYQWVAMFLRDPRKAREYVGPLNCTLGRVRELHDGASSNTEHDRPFPEGFLGDGLVVAVALRYMDGTHREMIGAHYVARLYDLSNGERFRRPVKVHTIAERMGLSTSEYANRRDIAKGMIRSAFNLDPIDLARARAKSVHVAQV